MKRPHPTDPNLFWCPKCEGYKDIGEFYKNKYTYHKISGYCKKCLYRPVPLKKKNCEICEGEFTPRSGKYKFCSQKCKDRSNWINNKKYYKITTNPRRIIHQTCVWCGDRYETQKGHGLSRGSKYCSEKCRKQYFRREKYKRVCVICNKEFNSAAPRRKTCSDKCEREILFGKKINITCPDGGNTRSVYENSRTTQTNKSKICAACYGKKLSVNARRQLTDSYIKSDLRKRGESLTLEVIELTRVRITMKRTLKQFKEWREENEHTDHRNVQTE